MNLFDTYGLRDLLLLWVASVLTGFVLYTGVKKTVNVVRAKRALDTDDRPVR